MLVAILAFPRVQLLDLVGPIDVFTEAARQLGDPRAYRVKVIAADDTVVKSSAGLRLVADTTIADFRGTPDTLLVAGGPTMPKDPAHDAATAWLQRQARTVRRLGGVCTGAFALAAAGLLDGRQVTTHWRWAERLAQVVPTATVDADRIHLRDGRLYTSAGVTAGIDLALAMVEEDHGPEIALGVARELVMFLKRPGGQSQFSAHLAAQAPERSPVRAVQDQVLADPSADLGVPALAAFAGMSERHFARVFRAETGVTPAWFVEGARIDAARRLVETSAMPLKRLAGAVGYANVDAFRRAFQRRTGVTPADYRLRFSASAS